MCGIVGLVALTPSASIEDDLLRRMCAVIRHRGPDDDGFHLGARVGLGMRRLSIIDVSGGHQPIYDEARTACVVFNGEIYNYRELVEFLEKRGHRFTTRSDTEVIIHAYEEWGEAVPEHLDGMFAFAIWDDRQSKLFVARDRLGKKPLYYTVDHEHFAFASEIKSLLVAKPDRRQLNVRALGVYLSLGYVPGPDSLFDGIHKLPAGHCLTVTGGQVAVREYWDARFDQKKAVTRAECREKVGGLLADAVRARLTSEVPLGAFLSGGIDSSVVVALMSRYMDQPVDTFSVGFGDPQYDELPYARVVARHLGTRHHELVVDSCSPALCERLVWHFDEPVADPAAVPTLLLSELARRHVTVVLTGEGGDEVFGGYEHYRQARPSGAFEPLLDAARRGALPFLARTVNRALGRPRYHERAIWRWALPPHKRLLATVGVFTDIDKTHLYHPGFRGRMDEDVTGAVLERVYAGSGSCDELDCLMYTDTKVWLADDLLMKVDKMSMAHSLEARTPYLDHRLVEFMATVPTALKMEGRSPKHLLREVARTLLPEAIAEREKRTFDVPIGKWLRGPLREMTLDVISSGRVAGAQVFDSSYLAAHLWHGLEAGDPGAARQIWTLLNLGLWARQYGVTL